MKLAPLGERLLTVHYPIAVFVSFGLGFLLRNQLREEWAFYPAAILTLPWSVVPERFLPRPVNAFLIAFYDLPLIIAGMTLNIACIGFIRWIRWRGSYCDKS